MVDCLAIYTLCSFHQNTSLVHAFSPECKGRAVKDIIFIFFTSLDFVSIDLFIINSKVYFSGLFLFDR